MNRGQKEQPPNPRRNTTYTLQLDGKKVHVGLGTAEDGRLLEVFIDVAKEGSALKTTYKQWAILFSVALQHGVPLEKIVRTFIGVEDGAPKGYHLECDAVPSIHETRTTSIYDAVVRLLAAEAPRGKLA